MYQPAPSDLARNLRYRQSLLRQCRLDHALRAACLRRASQDPEWWCDAFLWTYSPKECPEAPDRPFVLYPYQRRALAILDANLGNADCLLEKTRDMGASWIMLVAFLHRWMFRTGQSFLIGSRKEEYVDKRGDPKSLFWKLDYMLAKLPFWMRPRHERTKLHLGNLENGSTIDGESTNADFATGDRRTAVFLDEFSLVENGFQVLAATRDVTRCRIFNGTPKGRFGAYYEQRTKINAADPNRLIRMHWSEHPLKSRQMYLAKPDGSVMHLDERGKLPPDYPIQRDGRLRSPWYDAECARAGSPQEIAQELDIDYAASSWQFVSEDKLNALLALCRPPLTRGTLTFQEDATEPVWHEAPPDLRSIARWQLWSPLGPGHTLPPGEYVVACDVAMGSAGSQSSQSVLVVTAKESGNKVVQYSANDIEPEAFATLAVATARWAHEATLNWEDNGPGRVFARRVRALGYRRLYYREDPDPFSNTITAKAGWYTSSENKLPLLSEYVAALMDGRYSNPCREAIQELRGYIFLPNGRLEHEHAANSDDPTSRSANHGDMVIADAIAQKTIQQFPKLASKETVREYAPGSLGARQQQRARAASALSLY